MSKIILYSESLGEKQCIEVISDLKKRFLMKGEKLLHPQKKMGEFFLTEQDFFGIGVSHSV